MQRVYKPADSTLVLFLEFVFHPQLEPTAGCDRVCYLAKSRGLEKPDRDTKICTVDKIEYVGTKVQAVLANTKTFDHRQIEFDHITGSKAVARYAAVLAEGCQKVERIGCCQPQRLAAVARHLDTAQRVEAVG